MGYQLYSDKKIGIYEFSHIISKLHVFFARGFDLEFEDIIEKGLYIATIPQADGNKIFETAESLAHDIEDYLNLPRDECI
ncbi:MAG: hypothetical protein R2724_34340 [Bryobacterales bacterium]